MSLESQTSSQASPSSSSSTSFGLQSRPNGLGSYPLDPAAPLFVSQAVLTTAALGAATGATLGVIRSANPFAMSINMGINSGVVGLTFFSLREYLVSPLLLSSQATSSHTRLYDALSEKQRGKLPEGMQAPSIRDVREERLLDSALAGALSGGILSGAMRGPRTIVPAAITTSLIASALQLGINELRATRLKLLARRQASVDDSDLHLDPSSVNGRPFPSPSAHDSPPARIGPPHSPSAPNSTRISPAPGAPANHIFDDPTQPVADPARSLPARMMSVMSSFLPMRKLSDEEYLATLQKKRAEVDKRLGEIAAEEERLFQVALEEQRGPNAT